MKAKPSEPIKAKYATPLRFYELGGTRYLCVAPGMFTFVHQCIWMTQRIVAMDMTPLPEACNSFDWQPEPEPAIDPGPGHRLLAKDERVQKGDEYLSSGCWISSLNHGGAGEQSDFIYRRRIAPATRPFANAEEYAPHRDRWVTRKSGLKYYRFALGDYCEDSVVIDGLYRNWQQAHDEYQFEDGTPFGITNTPE